MCFMKEHKKKIQAKYTGFESCKNAVRCEYQVRARRIVVDDRCRQIDIILNPTEYLKQIKNIRAHIGKI